MAELDEDAQVNPAELLELVSGLRDKGADADDQPADVEYRKVRRCYAHDTRHNETSRIAVYIH